MSADTVYQAISLQFFLHSWHGRLSERSYFTK